MIDTRVRKEQLSSESVVVVRTRMTCYLAELYVTDVRRHLNFLQISFAEFSEKNLNPKVAWLTWMLHI